MNNLNSYFRAPAFNDFVYFNGTDFGPIGKAVNVVTIGDYSNAIQAAKKRFLPHFEYVENGVSQFLVKIAENGKS